MKYLIHVVGDIHQPLHAAALFDETSKEFEHGDDGWNKFKIKYAKDAKLTNLHFLFDAAVGMWGDTPKRVNKNS